ncbi:MAG: type II toxin-antitoxin system VapC family toxin [Acidobacteriaceae bacterium]
MLDTHVLVWLAFNPEKVSRQATSVVQHARNQHGGLAISAVTLYEIAMLAAKGRIDLRTSAESFLDEIETQFVVKPITSRICAETMRLPDAYPRDPMDRLIGATAIVEGLKLITADAAIRGSNAVDTIW